jgi:GNAT superfamily N-acetyltransferase
MVHAPGDARVVVRQYQHERASAAHELLRSAGYLPVRTTFVMETKLATEPAAASLPTGIELRTFLPGADDIAAYEAYEEAFADMWQRPRGTLEQFRSKLRRPYFDPELWLLAVEGDEIAATVLADEIDRKGWVEIVGVRRPWRGRGLALAMLTEAFRRFWRRGVTEIGLSVDAESPTGATRLYERAGMRIKESHTIFEKEIRPGAANWAASE